MGKLDGKVALITGGNSGIGLASARLFVAEGARVVITGRNPVSLQAAVEELGAEHAVAVQADATDPQSAVKAVNAAIEAFGRLDVVYANAGIAGYTPLGSTELATFEEVLRVNVTGTFFTVQAALPHLKAGASVILTGSVLAKAGRPGNSAYAASKGAVSSMTKVLASELSPLGIRVNNIAPGVTRTPIWESRRWITGSRSRQAWHCRFLWAVRVYPKRSLRSPCSWPPMILRISKVQISPWTAVQAARRWARRYTGRMHNA